MTKDQMLQLATVADLLTFKSELVDKIREMFRDQSIKEFYTPKEFAAVSGLKYSTVVNYCAASKLAATQTAANGGWLIHRSEVDRLIGEAKENKIDDLES